MDIGFYSGCNNFAKFSLGLRRGKLNLELQRIERTNHHLYTIVRQHGRVMPLLLVQAIVQSYAIPPAKMWSEPSASTGRYYPTISRLRYLRARICVIQPVTIHVSYVHSYHRTETSYRFELENEWHLSGK